MNTVSTRSALCWAGLRCVLRAAKAREVLYFCREFAAASPDELVTEVAVRETLVVERREDVAHRTSNDASSRVTKTCCPRRFTYPEFPVLTGLKD